MSEDDPTSECCPLCKHKKCNKHLLARFDESGDSGDFGVGLIGGRLYREYVKEIEQVLECARLAWVRSVRATGKPKAPRWIMKERGLQYYFDALGRSSVGRRTVGFSIKQYESDEVAVLALQADTDHEVWHAREDFLWEVLSSCGTFLRTEEPFEMFMRSTALLSWWAYKPREIIKRFQPKLRRILLEAGVKVKSISRARSEKQELERMVEGFARLMKKPTLAPKETAKRTTAKKVKRINAPTKMIKTKGAKKPS